jgi:phenylalanyl-tRNA synthetase alpha chain
LRTQTSTVQIRHMESNNPPVYIVAPGRVFRSDQLDATHSPVFHQLEGLAVDKNLTFTDLKGTLEYFVQQFFGTNVETKFIPHFFPFTEPSAEVLVKWNDGEWLEILGCGMVDPNVLNNVGYDKEYQGFAWGVGIERLAMLRYKIDHIKNFYENDIRFLRQF